MSAILCACGRYFVNQPCLFDNLKPANDNIRRVLVASDRYLRKPKTIQKIAQGLKALNIPRRSIPDFVADALYAEDIECRFTSGQIYELHDTIVDDVLPDMEHCRWLGNLIASADILPKQRAQDRVLPRLRLLELALCLDGRIDRPCRKKL